MTMPAAPTPTFAPSTPDMSTVAIVAQIIREVLMLASGLGLAFAVHFLSTATAEATITLIASAAVGIGSGIWTLYERIQAKRHAHVAAVEVRAHRLAGHGREVIGTALALEAFCIGVAVILVLLVIAPKDDHKK